MKSGSSVEFHNVFKTQCDIKNDERINLCLTSEFVNQRGKLYGIMAS